MAGLLKNSLLEKCSMLKNCSSFMSHLVHWLGKEELTRSTCLSWENMEVTKLPQIQHAALLGLFWHSHGCFPGVYWWYRGEPNGSGCHRNNPFVEVIAPPASKTEDTLCDRQSTALRFCGAFCEAQAHFLYQIILLPFHWACGCAGSGWCFSVAVGGCCVCSALLDTGQV